jgi:hypothetical protein
MDNFCIVRRTYNDNINSQGLPICNHNTNDNMRTEGMQQ